MDDKESYIKEKFYSLAKKTLGTSDSVETFNNFWDSNNYRAAYLVLNEAMKVEESKFYGADEKVVEDFYWLFVN